MATFTAKLMAIFIAIIMAGSILGIVAYEWGHEAGETLPKNAFKVGEYTFYEMEDKTFAALIRFGDKAVPVAFYLDPRKASEISLESGVAEKIKEMDKIYLSYDPTQANLSRVIVAASNIARLIPIITEDNIKPVEAFLKDANPVNPNIPIKTCENAGQHTAVVVLEVAQENKIYATGDYKTCVHIEGKSADDLILVADKLGLNLMNIAL